MAEGIDYSYGSGLGAAAIKAAGKSFVCRYLAPLPNSKCINKAEFDNLRKAGLNVVLVWEIGASRILSGHAGGVEDAREADRQAAALGAKGIPIYFACDFDSTEGQQAAINAYLDGCASVIGHGRVGLYGGYWPCVRAWQAHKAAYIWQAYAWSGSNVPGNNADRGGLTRHLFQYHNGAKLGPADVDLDRSYTADYGQWPRPSAPPADTVKPPGPQAAGTRKGPFTLHKAQGWEADGTMSLDAFMGGRHSRSILSVSLTFENASADSASHMNAYISGGTSKLMPVGLVFCTASP